MSADLYRMAFGYATSQVLYAAVRLGVPDALATGPMPLEQLARSVECPPGGLRRLVRALVTLGIVDIANEAASTGEVALTELGRPLCAGHPQSMRSGVLLLGAPAMWRAWGALADSVRTGEPAFDHVNGRPLFDYLAGSPELAGVFNDAMCDDSGRIAPDVVRAYDFSAARTVIDIGGGSGAVLAAVLAAAPAAHGIVFDTAAGAAGAAGTLDRAGLSGRWSIEIGDFFQAVPEGDVMVLKGVLHDWDDRRCGAVLHNCRDSITAGGRLLVLEQILPARLDRAGAAGAVMSDIAMLVYTGGRERSLAEFRDLLATGGFGLAGVTPPLADSPIHLLVAEPI